MARKQNERSGFSRFLDLIGLVDSDRDDDMEQETSERVRRKSGGRRASEPMIEAQGTLFFVRGNAIDGASRKYVV